MTKNEGTPEKTDRNAELLKDYDAGMSLKDIARKYGVSAPRVRQIADRAGRGRRRK